MSCKDCKHCEKKGLLVQVLRYCAVVADDAAALADAPALPGKLGKGVTDLALAHARYGARFLREGYLYVLTERAGIKSWEGHMVLSSGQLYGFPVDTPPVIKPEPLCNRDQTSMHAYMVGIRNAHEVKDAWFLFTPSALTPAKLGEYKKNAAAYAAKGKMQHFRPAAWLDKTTDQPHTLLADELHKSVIEYVLYHQQKGALTSPLGKAMGQQLFPAHAMAYTGEPANDKGEYPGTLGSIHSTLKRNGGAVLVVNDHIGITQELNDFRNAPLEGLQGYLAAKDGEASNEQRLQIYEAIQEVKTGFEQGIIDNTQEFLNRNKERGDRWFARRLNQAKTLRNMGRIADAEAIEKDVDRSIETRNQNLIKLLEKAKAEGHEKWRDKYESRLDPDEMARFKRTLDTHTQNAFAKAEARLPDHLKWFESDRLVDAFDVYDDKEQKSGFNFAIESAICSFGLTGKVGEAKIDAWINANSIDRKNLYMRGFYHNQKELMDAARQVYKDIQAAAVPVESASDIPAAAMLSATKLLVDGFKKTDAAFDEWVRNQKQDFSTKWAKPSMLGRAGQQQFGLELILFHKLSELTRSIFRKGVGGSFDKTLTAKLSGLLYARLGETAGKLRYDELMLKIDKSKLAEGYKGRSADRNQELAERKAHGKATSQTSKQIAPSLADLVADAQEKNKTHLKLDQLVGNASPPTNNYHQTRIGVVLGCIEMIGLGEKLTHAKMDTKSALEVGGSVMAVGSIVLDVYYSAAKSIREIQPYKNINAINKSADIVRGGLKLGAGVLGTGAGLCGAYLDYMKFQYEKDNALKLVYAVRMATGFVSAGFTIAAAFSYSGPLCNHMAKGYAKHQVRYRALITVGGWAGKLALRVRMLVWIARLNLIGLVLTAAEIGYLWFKDDDLQNWCEKSVFRRKKRIGGTTSTVSTERFMDATRELEELEKASQVVGIGA